MTPKPRPKIRRDAQRVHASLADRVAHLERVCARIRMGDMTAADEVTLAGDDEAMEALAVAPAPNGSRVATLMAGAGQNPLILGAVGNRAWQNWTPTWTGLTVGNGTHTRAKYLHMGAFVLMKIVFTFGSTSAITGPVSFTPPVTLATPGFIRYPIGIARLHENGASTVEGRVTQANGTSLEVNRPNVVGSSVFYSTLSATAPFTWGANDVIALEAWGEVA